MASSLAADRTFRNSRREAFFVASIWLIALLWTLGYCFTNAYVPLTPDSRPPMRMGMPSWVFWGIVLPALFCTTATFLFGMFGMRDDVLGEEPGGESV